LSKVAKGGGKVQRGKRLRKLSRAGEPPKKMKGDTIRSAFPLDARIADHRLDRLDSRDGFLRKREPERDGAEKLTVDVHGAAAHSLNHPGFPKPAAAEARENHALSGPEILENAEDFDLELFDSIALENGTADAAEAGTDIFERIELLRKSTTR